MPKVHPRPIGGTVPSRVALLVSLLLGGCNGGEELILPGDGEPAAIEVVGGDGQSGRVGEPLTHPVVVLVTDSRGRPVEGATVAFELTSAGPGAEVVPQERGTNSEGLADTRVVLGTRVGQQAGQARVATREGRGPLQAAFSATALSENANTMAAVAGQDQTGHVGMPLDDRLVVEVTDGFGNPVAGVPISWSVEGGGSVSDAVVQTGEDGRARVERTLGPGVGQQTTTASSEGLAGSPVTFAHTALAGNASRLVILSGNEQSAAGGSPLPADLVVRLVDAAGNGVPQTHVTWVVATGGGTASPLNTTTDNDGRASTRWTLGETPGEQRIDAVVSGVGFISFKATATAGAPASLFIRTQPSSSAQNGVRFDRQPVIQVRDARGNDVSVAGIQVSVDIGTGGGELSGTRVRSTDAAGRATFTDLAISGAPGRRTLVFRAAGYAAVTSNEINITAVPTSTTITGDAPDPSMAGSSFTVSFRVTSAGPTPTGNVTVSVSGDSPTCTGTLTDGAGSCQLTLTAPGNRTLTATYSGVPGLLGSSDTEGHTVTAGPPPPPAATVTTITADSPDPSVSGSPVTVSFRVTSGAATPTGTVTVTVSGGSPSCSANLADGAGSCSLTLNTVGERMLTATYSGGAGLSPSSDTEPHTVIAAAPPNRAPDADFNWHCPDLTCNFTDASSDQDGTIVSRVWDFGDGSPTSTEVNPSHTYPAGGRYTVRLVVTDDRGATDESTAGVDVRQPPPPNQPPTAAFTSSCSGLTCSFNGTGSSDPDGSVVNWSWSFGDGNTAGGPSPSHTYGSGGTYSVTLTVTDDDGATGSTSGQVTVSAPPPSNQPPTADFSWSCDDDLNCNFRDESSDDGAIVSWFWEFGDGNTSPERNPAHRYADEAEYDVTLTVTDNGGLIHTRTREVEVDD